MAVVEGLIVELALSHFRQDERVPVGLETIVGMQFVEEVPVEEVLVVH